MNKQVLRNKKDITNKTVGIKYQKNGQKLDSRRMVNGLESNFKSKCSSKQTCKEILDTSPLVMESFAHEPTTKEITNTNSDNKHSQLTNSNSMDSSINLSSPGLCSALQLANKIQLASIQIKNPKQFNMALERSEEHKQKVVGRANVPFTKQIFRNLIDLHINDDNIVPGKCVKSKITNYDRKFDSAFILSNFYEPSFSTQCCAKINNYKVDVEKVQFYNGVDMYNYTELFNSL